MKAISKSVLILSVLISAGNARAQAANSFADAISHQRSARQFAELRQWPQALNEAKQAAESDPTDPKNRDSWLLLGACEERLGHWSEARGAYSKYVSQSNSPEKSRTISTRIAELDAKIDWNDRYKWGRKSFGLLLGHSPTFNTQSQTEFNSEMKTATDFGLAFSGFSIGYKRASGTAAAFQAPTGTSASAPYAAVPAGSNHVLEVWYFQYDFALTDQPETKSIVWTLPVAGALTSNGTRIPSGKLYHTWGYDLAAGVGANIYTKSALSFDVAFLYHLGLPFGDVTADGEGEGIKDSKGGAITGSTTGTEVRVGLKLLFGTTPPEAD